MRLSIQLHLQFLSGLGVRYRVQYRAFLKGEGPEKHSFRPYRSLHSQRYTAVYPSVLFAGDVKLSRAYTGCISCEWRTEKNVATSNNART